MQDGKIRNRVEKSLLGGVDVDTAKLSRYRGLVI